MDFWEHKTLEEMTTEEWESLCDGCAKCCLIKLEEEDTGALALTAIGCELLDVETCRCVDYANRTQRVPGCLTMTPERAQLSWLPQTCAYRLVAQGEGLPSWHPLITGDPESVHREHASVRYRAFPQHEVPADAWEDYILRWIDAEEVD